MQNKIIETLEKKQMKAKIPSYNVGDTVQVLTMVTEGKKKRAQKFEGLIVKQEGRNIRSCFTVRRVVGGVGVEKTFLIHSPLIEDVKIVRQGKVRRAKLHYLRERIGVKASRVKAKVEAQVIKPKAESSDK